MNNINFNEKETAYYHLPGLFEFYDFYKVFLPFYVEHRDYFYDWCEIGSIYGAPDGCIWGGGRIGAGNVSAAEALKLVNGYGISARLTFSNSLLKEEHLSDRKCNRLCEKFSKGNVKNGVIVHSELLTDYLKKTYPDLYLISSTTKVITDFDSFAYELEREEFDYVVPDFRLNTAFERLNALKDEAKRKVEFLCNEACAFGCIDRKRCYENVSRQMLDETVPDFICRAQGGEEGYRFYIAMKNPGFISVSDIANKFLPAGFTNFKIEGRELGTALILEMLLYYMAKHEHMIEIREKLYLDNTLDIF